jgi:hypothetical protein
METTQTLAQPKQNKKNSCKTKIEQKNPHTHLFLKINIKCKQIQQHKKRKKNDVKKTTINMSSNNGREQL